MNILVTGAEGFIAKNLIVRLNEKQYNVLTFSKQNKIEQLDLLIRQAEFIFHLAGVNRPQDPSEFEKNAFLTQELCASLSRLERKIPIVFSSSIQAGFDTVYGKSKRKAEMILLEFSNQTQTPVYIFRLPNVFGKWCRPNYNSAIATFCYNTVHQLPLTIHDETALIHCVYIDDVIQQFLLCMDENGVEIKYVDVEPTYKVTVGEVAATIQSFSQLRRGLFTERVGEGFVRALYSTYLSYLPANAFYYDIPIHADNRGVFVEMLKTPDCGQFSYFTAKPGITRGGHYHHTKTEKFLVIQGEAMFKFKHVLSGETFEVKISGTAPQIVEMIPGWSHNITNIGDTELITILWANEVFNVEFPDTIAYEV